MPVQQTHTLIIGASFSGLASAASLQRRHIDYLLIEKEQQIAMPWRRHYDRLHLHTSKRHSHLPYKKFGPAIPLYPDRQQVIDYLESYRAAFELHPVFDTAAISLRKEGEYWITQTSGGPVQSKYIIMATGPFGKPRAIDLPGMESFPGEIVHSAGYRNGAGYQGQEVLVIGFGNSACEIAIDLTEHQAHPSLSVRSPVNIIPRDVLGIPVLELSLLMRRLSPKAADRLSAPLIQLLIGDIEALGLEKMPYGPLEQISRDAKAPVLDIGTLRLIRQKKIGVLPAIEQIEGPLVFFTDGQVKAFDAIIACIGYEAGFTGIQGIDPARIEDLRHPVDSQVDFGKDGLYFCGFWISPTGQIREISHDAQKIADDIVRKERFSEPRI